MTKEQKDFVYRCFVDHFIFMDASDIEELFVSMEEDIYQDIEETADENFHNGDVCIAIRRTLFKRLKLGEWSD